MTIPFSRDTKSSTMRAAPRTPSPTIDEDGEIFLHAEIEPYEDEATRDACIECGEKFRLRGSTAKADEPVEEELFYSGVAAESVAAA